MVFVVVYVVGYKVNSAFGMVVNDECRLKIQEHKTKQSFQFITLKINENTH